MRLARRSAYRTAEAVRFFPPPPGGGGGGGRKKLEVQGLDTGGAFASKGRNRANFIENGPAFRYSARL